MSAHDWRDDLDLDPRLHPEPVDAYTPEPETTEEEEP
jgi:hypothetical protein